MRFRGNSWRIRAAQVSFSGSSDPHREHGLPAATLFLRRKSRPIPQSLLGFGRIQPKKEH